MDRKGSMSGCQKQREVWLIYAQFTARNPSKACLNNDLFILKHAVNIQCENVPMLVCTYGDLQACSVTEECDTHMKDEIGDERKSSYVIIQLVIIFLLRLKQACCNLDSAAF